MRPSRRSFSAFGQTAALFLACLASYAQKPSGPPSQNPAPSPRKITVITNENLKYSVLTQPEHAADAPPPQPVSVKEKEALTPAEDASKKAAEIASLQKQIKDKQKRIELLMHVFVMEEKKFVQSSGDLEMDSDLQAKIRYEQEELRKETAACAQLQARLDALQGSAPAPH